MGVRWEETMQGPEAERMRERKTNTQSSARCPPTHPPARPPARLPASPPVCHALACQGQLLQRFGEP